MLEKDIFTISTSEEFEALAIDIFRYQYQHTKVYREFCNHLRISETSVKKLTDIPFLPIQFFKDRVVLAEDTHPEIIFTSSGTTGSVVSKHHVAN
jgi:Acyl-protein synthetase, LuxE.